MNQQKMWRFFWVFVVLPLLIIFVNAYVFKDMQWNEYYLNSITNIFGIISLAGSIISMGLGIKFGNNLMKVLSSLGVLINFYILFMGLFISGLGSVIG